MNAIVVTALKRPYTFVVLSILILAFGILSLLKAPTDVFPNIRIPVVSVVWTYGGMLPEEFAGRITYNYELNVTSTVEGIEHMESNTYYGRSIVNIYFQPGTDIGEAEAEVTAISQTVIKQLPENIPAPMVMKLEASSVPVLALQVTSQKQTPSDLFKIAMTRIRPILVTVPGAVLPQAYGGMDSFIMVALNQKQLQAHHLSAMDVQNALRSQNIVLPAGDQKIHRTDWMVQTNATPRSMKELGDIPVKRVGNAVIYVHDVANVYRGGHPQTNLVLVQGRQGVEIVVMKSGDASTLDVVAQTKALLPRIEKIVPPDVHISVLSDASVFVKEAITDVVREMVTAAILTGLVVLLFLGSWRSTVIIATSIPLAILSAIICLLLSGQTINVMTLGGLALAVGILVDDATVMIENIDTHLEEGKDLEPAIIDAANQIVIPTLVSTLCICIVWTPLFRLSGVAGWLFMPMAEAIVYAMLASFILSRTLVPTMAKYLLAGQVHPGAHGDEHQALPKGFFGKFQNKFEHAFHVFRLAYGRFLERILVRRKLFVSCFLGASVLSLGLFLIAGQDFFPEVKSGTIQMHMRAPLGTRIETTGRIVSLVDNRIDALLPGKVSGIINNCGLPEGPHNQAFIPTPTIGTQDCDLTISLKDGESPVWDYRALLRDKLSANFPGSVFTFQPADLTEKILNFGSPAPIDIQVSGPELRANYDYARILVNKLRGVPGAADVVIQQTMKTPTLFVKGNRTFSQATGMTEADIANNQLMTLSGSQTVDPQYWLDPKTGITFPLNVYVSQDQLTHYNDLLTIPVDKGDGDPGGKDMQLLGAISDVSAIGTPGQVSHFNSMPDIDIYVSAEGTDLGSVLAGVNKVIAQTKGDVPRSAVVDIHGQATTMHGAYNELIFGLIVSVVLIYMLIVVNFQSWVDPFIIISALPGALAGIAWSLFLTQTRLSVPALTGAIMCMGTATANSILVVAFAKERFAIHGRAITAAAEAGFGRIRPVIMTASAMIIGMVPMATSNSQNAPLGKAVIGGLIVATISTLLFVPCVYAIFHKNSDTPHGHETGEASENGKEAV
ncbi:MULTISPECIES: efflux RND transporter permease subunit [Acetobacter]|uniref:Efflux RND transporter permease subunit n=1 Tax=Acetobacter thailandicus TaxID=1502842 RepID=A0ABT3QC33_9PROT|nr:MULTISPECIES: efflux RND transporter permease subunit [Acetobacter]MBS0961186.1 efflux RND transporter permease subunit [Acetobacter thailandicus]MBS0986613.1 efflux RND transporter permease subunit [Acetobacter thailandicus]MBS1003834.1 efflux RND transporter permease subunit [Acetobacter thailandicus]MCX2562840.1 efflux RND transporter permease subunit [Acetobacter thailandicus]NHN95753.1 AcrB/AcrD/AcrF family protein [Acetobacter thailandicus]